MAKNAKKRTGQTGLEANKEKRTKRFEIRLTQDEWDSIHQRSVDDGSSSIALYARKVLLPEHHIQNTETKADYLMRVQLLASLGKIGSNVNQIARSLNRLKMWNESTKSMYQELIKIQEGITIITTIFKEKK